MEKFPYDEFICSDSKDIGPAPWNQVPHLLHAIEWNELNEENGRKSRNGQYKGEAGQGCRNDPHEGKVAKVQNEPTPEIKFEVAKIHKAPKRLPYFKSLSFLLCALVALGLCQSKLKELVCGTGLALCLLTRFFCNNDLLSYPFNIPLKAGCSLTPLLQPFHPQLANEYCDDSLWPWFSRPIRVKNDLFPPHNYASSGAGASIISELTSPTHGVPKSSWGSYFTKSLRHKIHIPPAFVILEDSIIDGECWRISGQTGKVGVRLSTPIIVSHITLDYINASLLSSTALGAAPRNMSLWSFVDDLPEFELLGNQDKKTPSEFVARGEYRKAGVFIRVADFQYNISLPIAKQRFSMRHHISTVTQEVVLFVESNEGGNTTCLYWIGIHGNAPRESTPSRGDFITI